MLSYTTAADPSEWNRKSATKNPSSRRRRRRRRRFVSHVSRRENPPIREQEPSIPRLIDHHAFQLSRRRAVKSAVAEPPLHLQKLAERSRSRRRRSRRRSRSRLGVVLVSAQAPPSPPPLRHHCRWWWWRGILLLQLLAPAGPADGAAGAGDGGCRRRLAVASLGRSSECDGGEADSH